MYLQFEQFLYFNYDLIAFGLILLGIIFCLKGGIKLGLGSIFLGFLCIVIPDIMSQVQNGFYNMIYQFNESVFLFEKLTTIKNLLVILLMGLIVGSYKFGDIKKGGTVALYGMMIGIMIVVGFYIESYFRGLFFVYEVIFLIDCELILSFVMGIILISNQSAQKRNILQAFQLNPNYIFRSGQKISKIALQRIIFAIICLILHIFFIFCLSDLLTGTICLIFPIFFYLLVGEPHIWESVKTLGERIANFRYVSLFHTKRSSRNNQLDRITDSYKKKDDSIIYISAGQSNGGIDKNKLIIPSMLPEKCVLNKDNRVDIEIDERELEELDDDYGDFEDDYDRNEKKNLILTKRDERKNISTQDDFQNSVPYQKSYSKGKKFTPSIKDLNSNDSIEKRNTKDKVPIGKIPIVKRTLPKYKEHEECEDNFTHIPEAHSSEFDSDNDFYEEHDVYPCPEINDMRVTGKEISTDCEFTQEDLNRSLECGDFELACDIVFNMFYVRCLEFFEKYSVIFFGTTESVQIQTSDELFKSLIEYAEISQNKTALDLTKKMNLYQDLVERDSRLCTKYYHKIEGLASNLVTILRKEVNSTDN